MALGTRASLAPVREREESGGGGGVSAVGRCGKYAHLAIVSTLDAKKGCPPDAPYVAAKSALSGVSEVLRQELYGTGVDLTIVLPGRIDTPMLHNLRVPWVSPKVPPEAVARGIIRGIQRRKAEVIVPRMFAPLVVLNALSPRFVHWVVRAFHLDGWEKK